MMNNYVYVVDVCKECKKMCCNHDVGFCCGCGAELFREEIQLIPIRKRKKKE